VWEAFDIFDNVLMFQIADEGRLIAGSPGVLPGNTLENTAVRSGSVLDEVNVAEGTLVDRAEKAILGRRRRFLRHDN
jgi:hypothetical protein